MKKILTLLLAVYTTAAYAQVPAPATPTKPATTAPATSGSTTLPAPPGLAPKPIGDSTKSAPGLIIRPATIDFKLSNGQSSVGKVLITNTLPITKQFTVYVNDFIRDSTGTHVYTMPGSQPHSCANWIKLDKTYFEAAPGQVSELDFHLQVPEGGDADKEMKWAMIFLETTQEQVVESPDGVKTTINGRMRVGVHVYQTPPNITERDVQIIGFRAPVPTDTLRTCQIVCENTGRTQIEITSYIELANTATNEKTKVDFPLFPMFPGQKRVVYFQIPSKLPQGKYSLIGVVDAGGNVPIAAVQEDISL
ncbi:hypothetical protein ACE38W_21260 [Chitinophaga sp. Hz27]|uniref:hypothetical protein n=1 Tax=Chitinophaga sp. Hz27 TaxID=3347169 RepID=UPI0035DD0653